MPPDLVGSELAGRYRLDAKLGAGGFGVVYRAWDKHTGREVALKVLREELGSRKPLRRRFAREAKALMALTHPNIVAITDYGVAGDMPFLAMELLEGHGLDSELKRAGALTEERAAFVFRQLLEGIGYMHAQGLVHRDLKPGNVFVQQLPNGEECIKLLDFGLAKFVDGEGQSDVATLTRTGEVFGTPGYMPPEQLVSEKIDQRADIYSAAVVMFQMLSGRRPFEGEPHDVLRMVLVDPPPPLEQVRPEYRASPELEAWFQASMAKEPDARPGDARALQATFDALPRPLLSPLPTRPVALEALAHADTVLRGQPPALGKRAEGAPAVDPRVVGRPRARKPGLFARIGRGLSGLLRKLLVASATIVSLVSVLVIGVAGVFIYALSRSPEGLPPAAAGPVATAAAKAPPETVAGNEGPIAAPATDGEPEPPDGPAEGDEAATEPEADPGLNTQDEPPDETVAEDSAEDEKSPLRALAEAVAAVASGVDSADETPDEAEAQTESESDGESEGEGVSELDPDAPPPWETSAVSPEIARKPARDPFRTRVPKALSGLRKRLLRGYKGNDKAITSLRRYNRTNPEDPRGHLLMAKLYMNRDWHRDAVNQYGFAYARDPSARGDRYMLRDLIRLAGMDAAWRDASGLIRAAYGDEATKPVERAMQRTKEDAVKQRLRRLLRQLGGQL